MIRLDISNNQNTIYATLKENSLTISPTYSLELFNYLTNVTYNYDVLSTTYSNDRIDRVEITLDEEINDKVLIEGRYKYTFYETQLDNSLLNVEEGLCKVVDSSATQSYYSIEPDETDDDYYVNSE